MSNESRVEIVQRKLIDDVHHLIRILQKLDVSDQLEWVRENPMDALRIIWYYEGYIKAVEDKA